jgi:hypothetical protein
MDTISVKIKLEGAGKFAAETRMAKVEIEGLGDATARANRKSRDSAGGLNLLQRPRPPPRAPARSGSSVRSRRLAACWRPSRGCCWGRRRVSVS